MKLKKLAALLCALVLCLAGLLALAEDETVDEGGSTMQMMIGETPVALLSTRADAGIHYCILCQVTDHHFKWWFEYRPLQGHIAGTPLKVGLNFPFPTGCPLKGLCLTYYPPACPSLPDS